MAINKRIIRSNDEAAGGASFNTVTYTGNGSATQTITGVGFEADLVWTKSRSNTEQHGLFDSVRGADLWLNSGGTEAETDYGGNFGLLSWSNDGFTVGNGSAINFSGYTYVAWCWKAGGAAVTNTDGTITSQVSANVEAGFSIVSYTGNTGTVGHGLGLTPKVIIQKRTDSPQDWYVYFPPGVIDGNYNFMVLNSTAAADTTGATPPTTTTFNPVASSGNYIAYCFAEVAGFSKIGSYTGTGSAGNFQDCGFEPAFVMVKRTDGTSSWYILDNKRDTTNPRDLSLSPDLSNAEGTVPNFINFESTGFSMASAAGNGTGQTWIYMAFANQF